MDGYGLLASAATQLTAVLILLGVVVIPIAAIAFARSGRGYDEIGKGQFAVDFDDGRDDSGQEEIRQLVEAKAFRQQQRGENPVDVESEIERLLHGEPSGISVGPVDMADDMAEPGPPPPSESSAIRDEIRQVVVANNERRQRRGEQPLDVETEIDRMLEEFG